MLAVAAFEVAVGAKRLHRHTARQAFAEEGAIAAKTAVEHGDLDALAAITRLVPAADAELGQMALPQGQSRPARFRGGGFRRRLFADRVAGGRSVMVGDE